MATIEIKIKVTDEQQIVLLKNFNEMTERSLKAGVNGYNKGYSIDEKGENENNLVFGTRCIKKIVSNAVKANALYTDRLRQQAEIALIEPIDEDISDDLLT